MSKIKRPDNRNPKELRNLQVTVGVLDRADGSARVQLGKNMVIASVFGPREQHPKFLSEAEKALVKVNYRMATFSVTDYKRSFPSRREKEISKVLSEAFESVVLTKHFPRSAIDIHVQIFESDGGTRTAAAIAISAALADAGIPMRDIIGGIASGLYEDTVCLDLCGIEDMKGTGDMPILYSPELDEVSLFQLDGKFTLEQFKEAFNTSKEAIRQITTAIRDALRLKYLKVKQEIDENDEKHEEEIQSIIHDDFVSAETEYEKKILEVSKDFDVDTPEYKDKDISSFDPDDVPEEGLNVKTQPVTSSTVQEEEIATLPDEGSIAEQDTEALPQSITTDETSRHEVVPEVPKQGSPSEKPSDEGENVVAEERDDDWYDKTLGLRPMGTKLRDTHEDVIRDIEYSDIEEDE